MKISSRDEIITLDDVYHPIGSKMFYYFNNMSWEEQDRVLYAERLPTDPLIFDCESTGIGDNDEIIGMAVFDTRTHVALINTLIRPVEPISAESSSLHGITNDDVRYAPSFAEICLFLECLLWNACSMSENIATAVLTAGIEFDRKMLLQTQMKNGIEKNLAITDPDFCIFGEILDVPLLRPYVRPPSADYDGRWLRNIYEVCKIKKGIFGCHGVFKPMYRYLKSNNGVVSS